MAVSDVWLRDGMLAEAEDQAKRALELCRNHPWSERVYAQERLANLRYIMQQIQLASTRHHRPPLAPVAATISTHATSTGIAALQPHQRVLGVFAPQPSPLQTPAFGSVWPPGAVVSVMGYYSPSSSPSSSSSLSSSAPRPSQQPTIARSPAYASPPPRGPPLPQLIAANPGTPYHGTTTVVTTHATTIAFLGHHQQQLSGPPPPSPFEPFEPFDSLEPDEQMAVLDAVIPLTPSPYT
jgi:hypothetical protein